MDSGQVATVACALGWTCDHLHTSKWCSMFLSSRSLSNNVHISVSKEFYKLEKDIALRYCSTHPTGNTRNESMALIGSFHRRNRHRVHGEFGDVHAIKACHSHIL